MTCPLKDTIWYLANASLASSILALQSLEMEAVFEW